MTVEDAIGSIQAVAGRDDLGARRRPTLAVAPPACYMQRMAGTGTGAERVRRRRDKLRAAGLRPVQIWVPDTRAAGFAEECARQARVIRDAETPESQAEDEAWFEVSDTSGWTA